MRYGHLRTLLALCVTGCAAEPITYESDTDFLTTAETVSAVTGPLETALQAALVDGVISNAEWTSQLAPLAAALPKIGSREGNALARVWADTPTAIEATAFASIRQVLLDNGYGVPRVASEPMLPSAVLIADNISTPDYDFERVARRAGVPANATITVAVLDDGINLAHPALADNFVTAPGALTRFDFVENDATLPSTDHGTGTSSMATKNTHRVKVLPLRIAVNSGIPASLPFGTVVSTAIDRAVEQGVKIISMSYVTNQPAHIVPIRAAMARHPDVLFLLAAGNGNTQLGGAGLGPDQFLPTMHEPNVMIVSNARRDGTRFDDSFGGSNYGTPWADVAMRGMDYPLAVVTIPYGRSRGTSTATPNVASVAARVLLIDPSLTGPQVKELLMATVTPHSAWTGLVNAGGLVDQAAAIRAAAAGVGCH